MANIIFEVLILAIFVPVVAGAIGSAALFATALAVARAERGNWPD